ncbi:MAG: alpha/beta fold hydrolase [Anaerolineales bacterium]|nr:alpha/beta fold hydrolase [Anaerolineales bacterium]
MRITRLRYWLNIFLATVIACVIGFAVPLVWISYKQAQSYLHPVRNYATTDLLTAKDIQYQDIELTTRDGVKLSAWYTPPKPALSGVEGNGAVILVAHGYGATRPEDIYLLFASRGYGVLAWDFRAHGKSGGEFSTLGYYEQLDVEAALDYALAQPDVKHVGAWGGSMGGATVILTAAKRPEIEAVVSDSAYPSLEDVLKFNMPIEFMQPLVLLSWELSSGAEMDRVRPVDEIAKINPRAVFIIDGWKDGAVAMNSPYRLYDAAGEPRQIWVEEGVPHLGMIAYDRESYIERVIKFFDEYLL